MLLKVADLAAQLTDYPRAAAMFEQCAKMGQKNPLQRFNATEYYLAAGICHLGHGLKNKEVCVCVCVCVYVCMYVCMYVYVCILQSASSVLNCAFLLHDPL